MQENAFLDVLGLVGFDKMAMAMGRPVITMAMRGHHLMALGIKFGLILEMSNLDCLGIYVRVVCIICRVLSHEFQCCQGVNRCH